MGLVASPCWLFFRHPGDEATSMKDRTTLLFGLGEFAVVDVDRVGSDAVRVVVETVAREAACPECGTLSARVKDRPLRRVKDLPCSGQRVELWWRKRRLVCRLSALDGGVAR